MALEAGEAARAPLSIRSSAAPAVSRLTGGATAAAPRSTSSAATTAPRYGRSVVDCAVPAVTLVASDGSRVPLAAELGRKGPVLVQFVFTSCPTICPVLTGTLAALERRRPGLRMLSISIDPAHDTPERLREYAAGFRTGPGWRFLTGSAADVLAVQRAFDVYRGDKMRHQPLTFLRASPGAPWIRLAGFPTAAELDGELRRLTAG